MKPSQPTTHPDLKALFASTDNRSAAVEEDLLEAFIEGLPGIFFLFDADGQILRWNGHAERVSGWSGQELSRMHPLQLIAEEDRALVATRIEEAFERGEASVEAAFLNRAGEKRAFFFIGRLVRVEEKPCLLGIGTDISGRKTLQQERDGFFALSSDLFCVTDAAGRIRQTNRAWTTILGWDEEDLRGADVLEFVHPDDRERACAQLNEMLEKGGVLDEEKRCLHKDGSFRWISWRAIRRPGGDHLYAVGRDVTTAREAAAALRDSEQRYRALFEINPLPMLVVDLLTGKVLDTNEAAEEHYGWSKRGFSRINLSEIWAEDLPMADSANEPEQAASALTGSWIHRKKGGETFDAKVSCRVLGIGPSTSVILLVEDITSRRQAAEFDAAISKLGQKLSETTTPAEAGQVIADISRALLGWDAFSITLYSPETKALIPVLAFDTVDGVLKKFDIRFSPGTAPSPFFEEVLNRGSQLILRENEDDPTGSCRPFGDTQRKSLSLMFVPVAKGERAIGVLSVQSYTSRAYSRQNLKTLEALASHCAGALERIRVGAELRAAERKFVQAFESSPIAMYVGTFDEGKALAVNAAFEQMMGYRREEIIGKNGLDLGFWENPGDRDEIYRAVREGRRVRDAQVRLQPKTGEPRHILVSVEVIEVDGERCLLFFNHDITERLHLESQLRQSQKLESIGQVTAGVAHDFNNMLTVIDGCTGLALAGDRLQGETRDLVERIASAAGKAAKLTRQLLAFSSRQKLALREVNLNALLEDLAKMLRQLLGPAIRLDLRCSPDLPIFSGDSGMIEQVVLNIAVNARDAMPDGGRLTVETIPVGQEKLPAVEPVEKPLAEIYVCLRFKDTGCGISPGNLPRLFEPFFTTKEFGKGNGLGLATAYGIIKQHGGWIDVQSRIGKGTTFSIYLPASEARPSERPEPSRAPEVPKGKERVLVVEDEPAVRDLICHVLKFYGYETLEADSASAALELWQTHGDQVDAVVTDMVMPGGMGGRELARRLVEQRPDLPVLYTSGYSPDIAGRDMPLQDGVNFLQKPFEASALAQTLRACIDGKRG